MRPLLAASLLLGAFAARAAAPGAGTPGIAEPCAAARAPIPASAAEAIAVARAEIDAYRASWRSACDPARGPADVAAMLSEAEALVTDVRTGRAVAALAGALGPGDPWPLPGVHRHGGAVDVDWATFAAFAPRGSVEDQRYFRGLARATRADGDPAWIGDATPDGGACLRLGDLSWAEVVRGIEEMERSRGDIYARRAAFLRERLMAALQGLGAGGPVCGCLRGDPLPALEAVAGARERLGTPAHRALVAAAQGAVDALRSGRTRVSWLRDAPDGPATGCGAGPR